MEAIWSKHTALSEIISKFYQVIHGIINSKWKINQTKQMKEGRDDILVLNLFLHDLKTT